LCFDFLTEPFGLMNEIVQLLQCVVEGSIRHAPGSQAKHAPWPSGHVHGQNGEIP
jgi:hypothetical protein